MSLGGVALSSFPGCDGTHTKSLVGQIVNDIPFLIAARTKFVSVENVAEEGFHQDAQIR